VRDPELRRKLTPTHPWGCKRPLITNDFYPAMNRANVELVTGEIERIDETGVVTRDGRAYRADTIVYATGFETTRFLSALDVTGRGGLRLEDAWSDGAQAYLGITTAGFPNLFMLYGPNTNNGSILYMLESQVAYAVRQVERMRDEGLAWVDVRPEVMARYNQAIQREIAGVSVWQASCNGYYRSASGRVVTQWPHGMAEFRRRTQEPDAAAYESAPALPVAFAAGGGS
jgi:cation diffusion facilitator CzcD-associated flavoprotein CzcO